MIFTRNIALALAALLAGCGGTAPEPPPFERAQAALARGDGLGAEMVLREMLGEGVARADLAAFMGEAELLQGNAAEARRWLAPGEFAPASAGHGFHMLGRLVMGEGDLPAAGAAFDRALQATPDDAELWVDIGRLRYRGGEQAQAVAAGRTALALGPDNPEALLFRAQIVRDSQGSAAALNLFERGLAVDPDNSELLAEYAATLGDLGRAKEALVAIRKLTARDPRNPRAFFLQAVIAARGGNPGLARSLLLRSGDLDRGMPAAMLLSGVIDLESGNYASAAQIFDRLARMQPDNRRVRHLLARSLAQGGSHRELIHRFADAPSSPYLAQLVGRSHEALGQRERAASFLDRAAHPLSGNPAALPGAIPLAVAEARDVAQGRDALSLVRGLILAGQPALAKAKAKEFLRRFPGSADAMGLAGDAALAANDARGALAHYRAAGEIRRGWPLVKRTATALLALGDRAGAERLFAEHLAGDPGNSEAAALLARSSYLRGDFARAGALLDHAFASGAARDPMLHALRAEVALRAGADDAGLAQARRAYRLQPMNPAAAGMLTVASAGRTSDALARR